MKNFKKIVAMVLAAVLLVVGSVAATIAYLTKETTIKHNVFTAGQVDVELTEKVDGNTYGGVTSDSDGGEYLLVAPGDDLTKEVNIKNTGNIPAYVAVTVTMNNARQINEAIDETYENAPYFYSEDKIQAIYDQIFEGWGLNHTKTDAAGNATDIRLTITGNDMPEHVLQVDTVKTLDEYTQAYTQNWFENTTDVFPFDGYYTAGMDQYEIKWTYYLYLKPGQDSTLFTGINVPEYFTTQQMAMFNGLEIDIQGAAIQAENFADAKAAFTQLHAEQTGVLVNSPAEMDAALANATPGEPLLITLNSDFVYETKGSNGTDDITPASAIEIDGQGKYTLTATGAGVRAVGDDKAPLTLKNLTVVDKSVSYNESAWEFGYLELGGTTLYCENVKFADPIMVESENATFVDCTFTGYTDPVYGSAMYGAWVINGDATFTGCKFAGTRGLKVCDMYASEVGTVVVDGCLFDNLTQKPGIAIDDEDTQDMVITIRNSTFVNCQAGDQGLFIYETDNTIPTLENNKVTK